MYGKEKKMKHGGKKKSMYMKGGQAKLDMNKDGKLTGEDFKMLGNKKMMYGGKMNADKDFKGGGKMKNSYGKGGFMQHD
mgnify:CR=1 FL=1|tara:strand:- start:38958 stop:39194 length:237 start_codon:yes stop_codon:yes gene_type:complete